MRFQPYAKAITAAIVTGLGTLQVAYTDNVITTQEWVNVAIATFVALGGVWAVPNVPAAVKASWGTIKTPTGTEVAPSPAVTEVKVEEALPPKEGA